MAAGCRRLARRIAVAFVITNETGVDFKWLHLYPSGKPDYTEGYVITEPILSETLAAGATARVVFTVNDVDSYDIMGEPADGSANITFTNLDLKYNNTVVLKKDGQTDVSNDVTAFFSDPEIYAASIDSYNFAVPKTDEAKTARLALMFMNKTGKDITEMYVYPSGYTNKKGDSLISEEWKNNTSDDMALWLTFDRPDAIRYDIAIKLANGDELKYRRIDLKNANSITFDGHYGQLIIKYDDTIGTDGSKGPSSK